MKTNTVTSNIAIENTASDIIPGTNWTYSDAASMAKECAREARLFGRKSRSRRRVRPAVITARRAANFLAQTGWTLADALSEAIECRRDLRLHGTARYASL